MYKVLLLTITLSTILLSENISNDIESNMKKGDLLKEKRDLKKAKIKAEILKKNIRKYNKIILDNEKEILKNQIIINKNNEKVKLNENYFFNNAIEYYNKKEWLKALYWFEADKRDRSSYYISDIYFTDKIIIKESKIDYALSELFKSANELKNSESQLLLANVYNEGKYLTYNEDLYFKWLNKSAEQGNVEAMFSLGKLYYNGSNFIQKDIQKSLNWFKLSYNEGKILSNEYIGFIYYFQNKSNKMLGDSFDSFYDVATKIHSSTSEYMVGLLFINGIGIDKDYNKGIEWLKKSYRQDNVLAAKLLFKLEKEF